jgi:hypothetical protein
LNEGVPSSAASLDDLLVSVPHDVTEIVATQVFQPRPSVPADIVENAKPTGIAPNEDDAARPDVDDADIARLRNITLEPDADPMPAKENLKICFEDVCPAVEP